ncbi:MAG: endonuclease/exonuclease/phosphatase family protein [Fuerstiella sp.]
MNETKSASGTDPVDTAASANTTSRTSEIRSESSPHLKFLSRFFQLIASGYLCVAILPVILPSWWLADLLANLRVQLVIAAAPVLLGLCTRRSWKIALCLIALSVYHSSWLVSPSSLSLPDTTAGQTITVMAANVWTGNQKYEVIERQIQESKCDVVMISELSFGLANFLRKGFTKDFPYHVEFPADRGNFGIGMYSRFPLENASVQFLTDDSVPTVFADVQVKERRFHLVGVHTLPPMGKRLFDHRNRHLQRVADHVRKLNTDDTDYGIIVLGDLNLTPWSPVFTTFLNDARLNQAVGGSRLQPTWYRWPLFPFGLVLDHVLLSQNLTCVSHEIGESAGSDHRFVTVEVGLNSVD